MPREDRAIIRSNALHIRITSAANSRAPHNTSRPTSLPMQQAPTQVPNRRLTP
jgi:hypothetical protein